MCEPYYYFVSITMTNTMTAIRIKSIAYRNKPVLVWQTNIKYKRNYNQ